MSFKKVLFFFLFASFALCNASLWAFTPTKQQIEQFKKLPKAQQEALAKQYGVNIEDILGQEMTAKDESLEQQTVLPRDPNNPDEEIKTPEQLEEERFQPESDELKPFGYDLFSGEPTTFAPTDSAPVPDDYLVAPGDTLQIYFFGKESETFEVPIDRSGNIFIPNLKPVSVVGLRFDEVKTLIKKKVEQELIGVDAFVTMGELRAIRIMVMGESYKPGSYSVPALTSISHAIFLSGGLTEIASLRNVQLKRNGKTIKTLDLYDLLIFGDDSNDIVLKPKDVVFIPAVGKQVTIKGHVNREAIYELKPNEKLETLLKMAGGEKAGANLERVLIERYSNKNYRTVVNANFASGENKPLQNGDLVHITASSEELDSAVTLLGAVNHPGNYGWQPGYTIQNIFTDFKRDVLPIADYEYSLIVRKRNFMGDIDIIQFSLKDVFSGKEKIELKAQDVIVVFSRFETREEEKNTIRALAKTEDRALLEYKLVQWEDYKKRKFEEFIGIRNIFDIELEQAEDEELEDDLNKLLRGEEEELKREEYAVFSRKLLLEAINAKLQAQSNHVELVQLIAVSGKVRYPGIYPLSKNGSVSDAIQAAGGLLEAAYLDSAELTRIDFAGDGEIKHLNINLQSALTNPDSDEFKLQSKDSLNVFVSPKWQEERKVNVYGEVRFPGSYSIKEGESLAQLVERIGGLKQYAFEQGAIFTRDSLRRKEKAQLDKLATDLRREIASKSFQKSITDSSMSYADTNQLLEDLADVDALGRLVIDLPSVRNGSSDFLLQNGDTLYIPPQQSTISVIGEVNQSAAHLYAENMTLDDYLKRSGGLRERADSDNIYIIKANGAVMMPRRASWFAVESTQTLEPGDTIVVPLDSGHVDQLTLWSTATQILYQLGVAAAAIAAL